CDQLKAAGDHAKIIETLEKQFANFPLPSTEAEFERPLGFPDFYHDLNPIIHPDNQTKFYESIASLQALYLEACKAIGSSVALPRMLVVGLSVMSVLDYVTHRWPLNKGTHPPFHTITGSIIGRFFHGNRSNPYYATNNPLLDKRLQSIKQLYSLHTNVNLYSYYQGIIDSEPTLKRNLLERYIPPADPVLASLLAEKGAQSLYCFITLMPQLEPLPEFQPLIKKYKQKQLIEQCNHYAMQAFLNGSQIVKQAQFYHKTTATKVEFSLNTTGLSTYNATQKEILLKHKYTLSNDSVYKRALTIEYRYGYHERGPVGKARSENLVQLRPSSTTPLFSQELEDETREPLEERPIDKQEIANRELFHLRTSPKNQLKLTLDYFQHHLSKLSDKACQVYFEATLFEPGLLIAELDKNPDFLRQIDGFIDAGLKQHAEQGFASETSLFFIRLDYLVTRYATEYNPSLAYSRLETLQLRLSSLLQINQDHTDSALQSNLHQYQFLTAMARLKLNPQRMTLAEKKSLLDIALPSYLYMNAKNNPNASSDSASQFELGCRRFDYKHLLSQIDPDHIGSLVAKAIEMLGLGVAIMMPTQTGSLFTVQTKQGEQYPFFKIDIERG
ncbi:MAG: hypothetical protein ACOYKA_07115, partial [Legionellaceae bacterium]